MGIFLLAVLSLAPVGCLVLIGKALDRLVFVSNRPNWPRRRGKRSTQPDIAKLARDLRRLSADHDELTADGVVGQALRMRAVQVAYDETLRDACRALDVDLPADQIDAVSRIQIEADLATRGLTW